MNNYQIHREQKMSNRRQIKQRVIQAGESALFRQYYVSLLDIFMGMRSLQLADRQDWKKGKIPYLEKVIQGN